MRIAALCDINQESDYSMFYYGGTAGLKPTTELVRQKYGQAPPTYHDYNKMLDKVAREFRLPIPFVKTHWSLSCDDLDGGGIPMG